MDYELIFWVALAIIELVIAIIVILPWNPCYDPKGDDPYRYCPKEGEDW